VAEKALYYALRVMARVDRKCTERLTVMLGGGNPVKSVKEKEKYLALSTVRMDVFGY